MPDDITDNDALAPFVVRLERRDERGGHFAPAAVLLLTPALRTSGLWRALPPDLLKDLLLLLTFLTPDGRIAPTVPELTEAMGVSTGKARARLDRLAAFQWRGAPLVREIARESGLDAWAPSTMVVGASDAPAGPQEAENGHPGPGFRPAGREAVQEHSRARYSRPREQVEREIAARMGWAPPDFAGEDPEVAARKRAAYEKMTGLGVPKEQALDLLGGFPLEEVKRQLDWLPYRQAKIPARLLVAAVEGGYAPPAALRQVPAPDPAHPGPEAGDRPAPEAAASEAAAPAEEGPVGEQEPSDECEPPQEHALEDLAWDLTGNDPSAGDDTGGAEEGPW